MGLASHLVESDSHKERASPGQAGHTSPHTPRAFLSGHVVCCLFGPSRWPLDTVSSLPHSWGTQGRRRGAGQGREEVVSLRTVTPCSPHPGISRLSPAGAAGGSGRGKGAAGHESCWA